MLLQPSQTAHSLADFSLSHTVSCDIDEQANSISGWTQNYEQLSAGTFSGCTTDVCFNGIQLFRETTQQHVHQTGHPRPGCEIFSVPLAMTGRATFLGRSLQPHQLMILRQNDELDFCAPQYFDVLALVIPVQIWQTFAEKVGDLDFARQLGESGVRSPHPTTLQAWREFLLSVLDTLQNNPHLLAHANLCHALSQTLLWNLINLLETLDPSTTGRKDELPRKQIVEQAKAYLCEHIDEPITIADLCLALKVSRRTLQYSFQEILDINPVRYLKAIRLNGVRRALKAETAQTTTVGDVAARWGFWHLSRFAAEYKQMFGELPSATLNQF